MPYILEPDFLFQKVYCFPRITVEKKKKEYLYRNSNVCFYFIFNKKTDFKTCKMTIIVKEKKHQQGKNDRYYIKLKTEQLQTLVETELPTRDCQL